MTETEKQARLAELEQIWRARFVHEPKLPTAALLSGAVSMAAGFGAIFFLIGAVLSKGHPTWFWSTAIFLAISIGAGTTNRLLASRWYRLIVIPWSAERLALKKEIDALRGV